MDLHSYRGNSARVLPHVGLSPEAYSCGVTNHASQQDLLPSRLKHLVADLFRPDISDPDTISDREPLIGGKLGLDSADSLELALCVEEEFGLALYSPQDTQRAFSSISSLTVFIQTHTHTNPARQHSREQIQAYSQSLPALASG